MDLGLKAQFYNCKVLIGFHVQLWTQLFIWLGLCHLLQLDFGLFSIVYRPSIFSAPQC